MNTKVEEIDEQVEHGNRLEIILYPRAERTQIAQYVRYSMRDSSKRVHKKRVIEGYFDMVGMGDLVIFGEFDTNGKPLYDKDLATTCFIVDGKRRIGDFGEFTLGRSEEREELSKSYFYNILEYSVKTNL